jgi:eukaryotic-like serine/threonine-protein kinase
MLHLSVSSLGKYEIIRKLAVGGMAELFLARQSGPKGFSKRVVIKRLLPGLTSDQTLITMFLDEARLAARLNHANVVQIYDLGSEDGSYFIAMEYVHGRNLAELQNEEVERGAAIPHGVVAYIVSRICRGLHYAHTLTDQARRPLQVVHRDVSPHNVIVSFQGAVKLLDFGIAKAASRAAETQAGLLKGKYAYMAPEQCKGELVDHRSDIFAAGIVLYELVCRRRLFRRNSDLATMHAVIEDPIPPPSAVHDEVPDELEAVIMRALNRRPEERYQSAQEMQVELEQALQANHWAMGPDQVADYIRGIFPDVEGLEDGDFEDFEDFDDDATVEASPELLESLKAGAIPGAIPEADLTGQVTVPGVRRSDLEALTSGSTDLTDEHDLLSFDDDEEIDQTLIKPPDFDDIVEEPMGVEDDGSERPVEAAPPPPSAPARPPPPSLDLDLCAVTEDLDPPTEDLKSPRKRAEQGAPPPEGDGYPLGAGDELPPPAAGNRVLIPLLLIAVVMVLIGGGLAAYILLSKRGPQADAGLVSLVTEPPGATVYLNAEKRFETTPMTLHGVPLERENLLVLMLEGHKIWRKRFTLGGQNPQRTFSIKLVRTRTGGTGRLIVEVREAGARVFLNGDYKGKATLTVENVTSGVSNELVIKKLGYEDKSLRVDALAPGERRRIVVGLRPANKGELEHGVKQRSRKRGSSSGPVVVPRAKTTALPLLGGQDLGERVPGK